jgi:hypothetical protein
MSVGMHKRTTGALGEANVSAANVMTTPNAFRALVDYYHVAGVAGISNVEVTLSKENKETR